MTPEEKARQKIDRMFADAGWDVIDREEYSAGMTAVAIREGLLKGNKEADYFLFLNGKAVGVLEAKREEVDVTDQCVCEQAEDYAQSVPPCYPAISNPLPIVMTSNGRELYMSATCASLNPVTIHLPRCLHRRNLSECSALTIPLQGCQVSRRKVFVNVSLKP